VGETLVAGRAGFGAGEEEAPLGDVGERAPDLLTVDHPLAPVTVGPGADAGEVGAGVGLAVALTPVPGRPHDVGDEALLLGPAAEREEGGAEQRGADVAEAGRGARRGELLVEGDLL